MPVISNKRITNYLQGFTKDPYLQTLLRAVYSKPLSRDRQYLEQIPNVVSLATLLNRKPDRKLNAEFYKSSKSWHVFRPTKSLTAQLKKTSEALEKELQHIPDKNFDLVRTHIRQQLREIGSIDDATALLETGSSLINLRSIQNILLEKKRYDEEQHQKALMERPLALEEYDKHIEYIHDLPDRHFLFQIKTQKGMTRAGKNAGNCLGSMIYPSKSTPHRLRVEKPERWLYFTARDINNKSAFTVMVDRKHGIIESAGNEHMDNGESPPVSDEHWDIYKLAEREIIRLYPDILNNVTLGSSRHRIFINSGYYSDLDM